MAATTQPFADAALRYAELGLRVIPLRPKTKDDPLIRWREGATADAEQIAWWVRKWGAGNIGIAAGQGIVIVDVDLKHGGLDALATLEAEHGALPVTVTCETGGGGLHYYFATSAKLTNRTGALPSGIDIRGDGGYVVAPPSIHPDGGVYRWRGGCAPWDRQPEPLPEWVLALIHTRRRRPDGLKSAPRTEGQSPNAGEPIPEGRRHETLMSLAGSMRRRGMIRDEIKAALDAVNLSRCDVPLDDEEVQRIAESAASYEPEAPATLDDYPLTDTGNAERLVLRHGRDLRYCCPWRKWLAWDGRRWTRDETGHVMRHGKETLRARSGSPRRSSPRTTIGASWCSTTPAAASRSGTARRWWTSLAMSPASRCSPSRWTSTGGCSTWRTGRWTSGTASFASIAARI